jgi:hypothetical protein
MSTQKRLVRNVAGERQFVMRRIGPETIIVPVAGRVGDLESVYTLNEVATRIWELLESPRTAGEIATLIANDYDASENKLAADLADFLQVLEANGLVRATPGRER